MSRGDAWAQAYERAWRAGDGDAAAELYAQDCVFRSQPFRELENARVYMRRVVPEAEAPEVWFGTPVEDGDSAAVEYWALLVEPNGEESTIAGTHRMRFGSDGLVAEARDYWHVEPGHCRPPTEWGR
ncbi:MAG: nuclear transport factor 2 family protein [Actinomycetota bacterium]|nr:nuclear transport factor 2 family protein [Actinomycetota bacterium]